MNKSKIKIFSSPYRTVYKLKGPWWVWESRIDLLVKNHNTKLLHL